MTREEAIEILKNPNEMYQGIDGVVGYTFNPNRKNYEAFQLAIKALEQEPCEDCISRQAVRDVIFAECSGAKLDIDFAKVLLLQRAIKALPPVTPQPKMGQWIESKGYDDRDHFYICSECGRCINLICGTKLADYPYCHCGAKMEVEE